MCGEPFEEDSSSNGSFFIFLVVGNRKYQNEY